MIHQFDHKIKKQFEQTEIAPSDALWQKIEASLPVEKNRKIIILPWYSSPIFKQAIAASVMFLLGGASMYYLLNESPQGATNTTAQNIQNLNTKTPENTLKKEVAFTEKQNSPKSEGSSGLTAVKHSLYAAINNSSLAIQNAYKTTVNHSEAKNMKASDYVWVYNEENGTYSVHLKSVQNEQSETNLIAKSIDLSSASLKLLDKPAYMAIVEKKEEDKKKNEVVEKVEEPVFEAFKSKKSSLNYKGFWLGPQVGFEGIFVDKAFYSGGSFGIDLGYDFGNAWGVQTGVKYAINSKYIASTDADGNDLRYKSEMNSIHVPILARYKFTKLTQAYSKPLSLNILGGLDYAYADRKKLHQLGLNLGLEYDVFMQADLMLTFGARGGMYNNLNLYHINQPEKITRYNYLLNAYVSVRFIDWIKK